MPIYPYYCDKCKKEYEIVKSMSVSDRQEECPKGHKMRRLFMPIPFHWGAGFLGSAQDSYGGG